MNWDNLIPIIIFILYALVGWFCYWLGCETVQPIEDINDKILERRKELEDDIFSLKNEEKERIERNNILDEQFDQIGKKLAEKRNEKILLDNELRLKQQQKEEVQDFIDQSEKLANEKADAIYQKRLLELEKDFKDSKEYYTTTLNTLTEYIQTEKEQLESLKATRAAAIEAAKREKEIQEDKDDYCLVLPIEYRNDVKILRSVSEQIAKPRSILMAIWQAYYAPLAKKKFPQILNKTDVCGIYKITNQETGECYIGQAVDIRRRWMDHCKAGLGIDTPQGNQLYAAMLEYGLDSFSFELLLECESNQLNEKEKYFIELYNSDAIGYNMNKGVK